MEILERLTQLRSSPDEADVRLAASIDDSLKTLSKCLEEFG
jgi:hypothetical protein